MSRFLRTASLALLTVSLTAVPALAGEHRIGFGYHYFETLDDIEIDDLGAIEDSGNSIVVSYQYLPGGLLRFEADIEYWEDGFGGVTGEEAYAPQIYLLAGRGFYGGVGVGMTQSDGFFSGDDWSDPWYAARVGVDLLLLPKIHLDINANYRFDAWSELEEVETEILTLGAIVRFSF